MATVVSEASPVVLVDSLLVLDLVVAVVAVLAQVILATSVAAQEVGVEA